MNTSWYDKQGKPISDYSEIEKLLFDKSYKVIKQQTTNDGKVVSTVWLGLNHRFGLGEPLIFETMVFPEKGDFSDLDMERYSTLKEAKAGHKRMFEKYNNPQQK